MEPATLKRKLSTYIAESGRLRNVPEELLSEVLSAWEGWSGTAKDFYTNLGFSPKQMATLIGKAKRLKREGHFGVESFKELSVPNPTAPIMTARSHQCQCIELETVKGQVIRFPAVEMLMEFLEKAG